MVVGKVESYAEYVRGIYKDSSDDIILPLLLNALIAIGIAKLVDEAIKDAIEQRPSTARSKEMAQIIALNREESYMAEPYCVACYSPATSRCGKCEAVAYCSGRCQIDHWEQGHKEECRLMEDVKGSTRNVFNNLLLTLKPGQEYMAEVYCAYCDSSPKTYFGVWPELDIFQPDYIKEKWRNSTNEASESGDGGCSNCKVVTEEAFELEHLVYRAQNLGATAERPRQVTRGRSYASERGENGIIAFQRSSSCSNDSCVSDAISSLHDLDY